MESPARASQLILGAAAWLWVAGLILAPAALHPFGTFICHQRPERSFFISGTPLPVCARCTGLYVGAALAVPFALRGARAVSGRRAQFILAWAALPTALTWTLEFAGVYPFSNAIRFAAALPLGCAAAWLVLRVIRSDP